MAELGIFALNQPISKVVRLAGWIAHTYKFQFDIESSVDLRGILKDNILDAKIEFIFKNSFGIAKKRFYELIINVIKKKIQTTSETMMIRAIDSLMTKEEYDESG